jgi:virulence-associated protein VagC
MPKAGFAKIFANGQSQAVRLPKEFRFTGEQVRIRRVSDGVLLQSLDLDPVEWFGKLTEAVARVAVSERRKLKPKHI